MAVLTGDALLNYAFETAAKAFDMEPERSFLIGKAMQILGKKAGIYGMIGGQVVDVESAGQKLDQEVITFIYSLKTCALIEIAMMIGAVLAGASEEDVKKVESIAWKVGMAFQIQDDILDVISTDEVLGKPVHSYEKNEKTTYVTLVGYQKAKEEVERLSIEEIFELENLEKQNPYLMCLIEKLIHRER